MVSDSRHNIWVMHRDGLPEQFDPMTNRVSYRINVLKTRAAVVLNYIAFIDRKDWLWIYCSGADNGMCFFDTDEQLVKHFNKTSAEGRLNFQYCEQRNPG